MDERPPLARGLDATPYLLIFGLLAFCVAALSLVDMMVPQPYDGVVLAKDGSELRVREVVEGSGADRAGLERGDLIVGVGRDLVREPTEAARILRERRIGDRIAYLVKRPSGLEEVEVELGRRRIGDGAYLYICALGFAFFFVGLMVLIRQPARLVSQVFFVLCNLFLLFLVCRLRLASYSGIDTLILAIGTGAFLFLPPAFLHFYLLFPRPTWLQQLEREGRGQRLVWLVQRGWPLAYLAPVALFLVGWAITGGSFQDRWIGSAPTAGWVLLIVALVLGLWALRLNARRVSSARERRGAVLVLVGSLLGLGPFTLLSLFAAESLQSTEFAILALGPLALLPITFTYAIVRFQLLDVRIILRRSLLYTVTTALVTAVYAAAIATFNLLFRETWLATTGYFPIILALAIVLLFDPVRRRVQTLIDRSFFAGRSRLELALAELGEAMAGQSDLEAVVRDLADRLPQALGCQFAALYVARADRLERRAGPPTLPTALPALPQLRHHLGRRRGAIAIEDLVRYTDRDADEAGVLDELAEHGVAAMAGLASRRRDIGLFLFSRREDEAPLEADDRELLARLMDQTSVALETGLLLEERTRRAELEREMEIAAEIQQRLLPSELRFADGWSVAAHCLPSRIVGGDFFTELQTADGRSALVYGDVSGKSVSAALVMMAAHEALCTLSMSVADLEPSRLFDLANKRLYALGRRSFVALGYLETSVDGRRLRYLVAGQPALLRRKACGTVEELALGEHRVPIGALPIGAYRELEVDLDDGEVVLGYSDGVTDARAPDGEFFGEERLLAAVAAAPPDPDQLVDHILQNIRDFTRGDALYDDVTLVAVARSTTASMGETR